MLEVIGFASAIGHLRWLLVCYAVGAVKRAAGTPEGEERPIDLAYPSLD
jgi:hypothetical protein